VEALLVAIFIASGLIAFGVGRWWTLVVPIAALGLFYGGIAAGWWGNGFGDGWQFGLALVIGAGILTAAVGVAARVLVKPRAEPPVYGQEPS
jgi:hypothetical protein